MENSVTISLDYYNKLRDTDRLYSDITTKEVSVISYYDLFGTNKGDRYIVTNESLMKELIEKNNNFAKILNDQNREIYSLKTNQHQIVYPKPSQIEIKGFWKRLDWLLNGKVK